MPVWVIPVCVRTGGAARPSAIRAASWRPERITTTGFARAAARAADMNFGASVTVAIDKRIARVRMSAAKWSRQSAMSTSRALPRETMPENPVPRPWAQATMPAATVRDCEISARSPGSGARASRLALSAFPGTASPMLSGPTSRNEWRRAAARAASASESGPLPRPVVMTTAAPQPLRPAAATTSGTVSGGVTITTRSAGSGRSARSAKAWTPSTLSWRGFTGQIGPAKPASRRLRRIAAPNAFGRALAPTSATERGLRSLSKR
jgi:hypothetical protein